MGYHDIMQACLNGHTINAAVRTHSQFSREFCDQCGERTIIQCPSCKRSIEGLYQANELDFDDYDPREGIATSSFKAAPAYCCGCGAAFPWTAQRIQAAVELFAEEGTTTAEDVHDFEKSLQELAKGSPLAPIAELRMEKLLKKASAPTFNAIRDILVNLGSGALLRFLLN